MFAEIPEEVRNRLNYFKNNPARISQINTPWIIVFDDVSSSVIFNSNRGMSLHSFFRNAGEESFIINDLSFDVNYQQGFGFINGSMSITVYSLKVFDNKKINSLFDYGRGLTIIVGPADCVFLSGNKIESQIIELKRKYEQYVTNSLTEKKYLDIFTKVAVFPVVVKSFSMTLQQGGTSNISIGLVGVVGFSLLSVNVNPEEVKQLINKNKTVTIEREITGKYSQKQPVYAPPAYYKIEDTYITIETFTEILSEQYISYSTNGKVNWKISNDGIDHFAKFLLFLHKDDGVFMYPSSASAHGLGLKDVLIPISALTEGMDQHTGSWSPLTLVRYLRRVTDNINKFYGGAVFFSVIIHDIGYIELFLSEPNKNEVSKNNSSTSNTYEISIYGENVFVLDFNCTVEAITEEQMAMLSIQKLGNMGAMPLVVKEADVENLINNLQEALKEVKSLVSKTRTSNDVSIKTLLTFVEENVQEAISIFEGIKTKVAINKLNEFVAQVNSAVNKLIGIINLLKEKQVQIDYSTINKTKNIINRIYNSPFPSFIYYSTFKGELTIPGIGGLRVGHLFKLKTGIKIYDEMQKDLIYVNQPLRHVIIGVRHNISATNWTTGISFMKAAGLLSIEDEEDSNSNKT